MAMQIAQDGTDEHEVLVDINTTPLIDVMLVLLIMLIITIPIQTHAVKLDMPAGRPPPQTPPAIVRVEIGADGAVLWNGEPIPGREVLEAHLREVASAADQPEVHVRPDGHAKYGPIAMVLATAQRVGVTRLGIIDNEWTAD